MTDDKIDRRIARTRDALMSAFVELVLSEGYAPLTVDRIAAKANVGRSTFYLHYTGKEDMLKRSLTRPSSFLVSVIGQNAAPGQLIGILNHFAEQRRVNHIFFVEPIRPLWVKRLAEMIEPRLARLVRLTRGRPLLPLPLIAMELAEAEIGLIVGWLNAKPVARTEAVAEALIASTRAMTAALLRVPSDALVLPAERSSVGPHGHDQSARA